jgi:cell fate (sporulation/competence/biofilm development) regulator YlbF (YheA/YmcA/DUF963 family)
MNEEENNDPIGKALGLEPYEKTESAVSNIIADAHNDSAKVDFETARANIHGMLMNGNEAMVKLAQIADSSQHPRAFEVLAKLMDTMLNANQKLLDLQSKIREIDSVDTPISDKAKTINNNLFVGSTAELQKVLQDMKKNGNA